GHRLPVPDRRRAGRGRAQRNGDGHCAGGARTRADRGARRLPQRLRRPGRRCGAGRGPAPGRARCGWGRAGSAGRHPARCEGPRGRRRLRHHQGLGGLRRRAGGHDRLRSRGAAQSRRRHRRGQDEHARARLHGRHGQRHLRRHPQPLEPRPLARRVLRRECRGRRRRHGAARHRVRRRWLHPHPCGPLWPPRLQAQPRPCADRWSARPRLAPPLQQGGAGPHRRRHGARPRRRAGPRPHRPALAADARAVVARRDRGRTPAGQGGLVAHPRIRRGRPGGPGHLRAGGRPAGRSRGGGGRGARRLPLRPGRRLAHLDQRVQRPHPRAVPRHGGVGAHRSSAAVSRRELRCGFRRGAGARGGRGPRAQPPPRRAVPRRPHPAHADDGRSGPAQRRSGHGERAGFTGLGGLHLPVQHDPVAGGFGVRRLHRGRPAGGPAARRPPARRHDRAAHHGRHRGCAARRRTPAPRSL
ncbi:MAG: Aspartyl-tRNA(Asn) amidotransferase subunit A @ Glutamyl-tRNA(Gln) amidotransferase subunit A, partial [uncultured Acidimicrobiales bacterium]